MQLDYELIFPAECSLKEIASRCPVLNSIADKSDLTIHQLSKVLAEALNILGIGIRVNFSCEEARFSHVTISADDQRCAVVRSLLEIASTLVPFADALKDELRRNLNLICTHECVPLEEFTDWLRLANQELRTLLVRSPIMNFPTGTAGAAGDAMECKAEEGYTPPCEPEERDWAQRMVARNYYDPQRSVKSDGPLVAIIDSGVYSGHGLLQPALVWCNENLSRFKGQYSLCIDGDVTETFPEDTYRSGHGTVLAWLIAGAPLPDGDNIGSGLARGAQILPVRVTDGSSASACSVARGICVALRFGAKILVNTCTSFAPSLAYWRALNYLQEQDAILFTSSGNCDRGRELFPACYTAYWRFTNVVSVGACESNRRPAWFNNDCTSVDFLLPGYRLWVPTLKSAKGWGIRPADGTSYAAPLAAAALRLACDFCPPDEPVCEVFKQFRPLMAPGGISKPDPGRLFTLSDFRPRLKIPMRS